MEYILHPSPKGNPAALQVPVPRYGFGIWTPIPSFDGGNTGMTGTHFSTYQRIGNRVYIDTNIVFTAKGSSTGNFEIYGLPFGSWGNLPPFAAHWLNMTSSLVTAVGLLGTGSLGSTAIFLKGLTAAGTSLAALTHADFSDTTELTLSGFYTVDAA